MKKYILIFNNGHGGPDRGHGHGIYAQNKKGIKRITDNVIFQQFGYGMHVYGSSKASLRGFRIEGNVVFHNGCLQEQGRQTRAILVGGGAPLEDVSLRENMIYNGGLRIGYSPSAVNKKVTIRKNYVVGMSLDYQRELVFEENTVISGWPVLSVIRREKSSFNNYKMDHNTYYNVRPKHYPFFLLIGKQRQGLTLKQWQKKGFDAGSTIHQGHPKEVKVFVRPNRYESGRANVIVFNWSGKPKVTINLQKILKKGQRFRIVSARNFFGPAVVSGKHQGAPISLPMSPITPAQPVGMPKYKLPPTEPRFGAYVLLSG